MLGGDATATEGRHQVMMILYAAAALVSLVLASLLPRRPSREPEPRSAPHSAGILICGFCAPLASLSWNCHIISIGGGEQHDNCAR